MKRLFILFATVVALISCNESPELGPEYKAAAKISNVTYPEVAYASQEVSVTAYFSSEYGLYSRFIRYWLNDDLKTIKDVAGLPYNSTQFQATYSGKIPGHAAGVKVSFQIGCWTPYSVLSATEVYSYTVQEPVAPQE